MAQLGDDRSAFGGRLTTTAEALARIALYAPVVRAETAERLELAQARGRVLAEDVIAALDVPPADNAAVDGYAVRFDDLDPGAPTRLLLAGRIAAGHAYAGTFSRGTALRVFTGAHLPAGPDTVLMQEDCREEGNHVVIPHGIHRGANRRKRGEDIVAGRTILAAGMRLRAQDLGLAAAAGRATLTVHRRLAIAVFSSGDELCEPGSASAPGTIYDSNRHVLTALLADLGAQVSDLGILPDRAEAVRTALADAARGHDLVMTSGGVSTGEEDHVRAAIAALGRMHFWRLAIRPGRPIAVGEIAGVAFMGLPGNPVAAMVTFVRFARPLILRLAGCSTITPVHYAVRAGFAYKKKPTRREWLRVRLERRTEGLVAVKFPREGAGILSSLVEADGLVELPEDMAYVEEGEMVDFLPFNEVR